MAALTATSSPGSVAPPVVLLRGAVAVTVTRRTAQLVALRLGPETVATVAVADKITVMGVIAITEVGITATAAHPHPPLAPRPGTRPLLPVPPALPAVTVVIQAFLDMVVGMELLLACLSHLHHLPVVRLLQVSTQVVSRHSSSSMRMRHRLLPRRAPLLPLPLATNRHLHLPGPETHLTLRCCG